MIRHPHSGWIGNASDEDEWVAIVIILKHSFLLMVHLSCGRKGIVLVYRGCLKNLRSIKGQLLGT